jgi:hypothetical protein
MKSFVQYISEVATDKLIKGKTIHYVHEKLPLGIGTGNHVHNYHIEHPKGGNYKVSIFTRTENGKKMSTVHFADPGGHTARTGKHDLATASKVLSQVNHVVGHHVETEDPHGVSFVAEKEKPKPKKASKIIPKWENPIARPETYRKMAKRGEEETGLIYDKKRSEESKGLMQHYVRKKKK